MAAYALTETPGTEGSRRPMAVDGTERATEGATAGEDSTVPDAGGRVTA
jgi:hypothetical protein